MKVKELSYGDITHCELALSLLVQVTRGTEGTWCCSRRVCELYV